jgi:predicted protein tyrosine phosphatase
MPGYIYLIREAEFVATGSPIYKLGKARLDELKYYIKSSDENAIEIILHVDDQDRIRRRLNKKFKETFKQRKDIGVEYFEGDRNMMILIICEYNCMRTSEPAAQPILAQQNVTEVDQAEDARVDVHV